MLLSDLLALDADGAAAVPANESSRARRSLEALPRLLCSYVICAVNIFPSLSTFNSPAGLKKTLPGKKDASLPTLFWLTTVNMKINK